LVASLSREVLRGLILEEMPLLRDQSPGFVPAL
jgi:hypothetical protein